jgi:hypothetical protein
MNNEVLIKKTKMMSHYRLGISERPKKRKPGSVVDKGGSETNSKFWGSQ